MQGLLLVDKPADWTSFDVVNYTRRIVAAAEGNAAEAAKPKHVKVGHTGTLDPFATGLLVLLVGKEYTRRAAELSKLNKTYEITLRFGATSSTGDPEGEITPVSDTQPSRAAIESALARFRGPIQQVPPAYSAIKINGRRAYKLARAGKEVTIEPRSVTINQLDLIDYTYPTAKLVANVSSGTYIRTLVEDLAIALGTGAYTTGLRRTTVGSFSLNDAHAVDSLNRENLADLLKNY